MMTYGFRSIGFYVLTYLCLLFFSIHFNDVLGIVAWTVVFSILGILLLAVVKFSDSSLTIFFLGPFRKRIEVKYADISRIIITAGGRNTRITIVTNDFVRKEYLWLLFGELKKVNKQLKLRGVNVESNGKKII